MAQFDYVSDLHIDYWDPKWRTLYMVEGNSSNFPLKWDKMSIKSDILIVAGDVCDKLEYTIAYLKELKKYYKKILFVDGNHEHTYKFPHLYTRDYIASKFKGIKDVFYLPKEDVIIGDTAFIGVCGWWDYGCKNNIKACEDYFKNIIKKHEEDEKVYWASRVVKRASDEAEKLNKKIERYEKLERVKDIVIITHTIPLPKFSRRIETEYNTFFENLNLINGSKNKIKRWVFGHTHDEYLDNNFGIRMMCHPRGRPEDHNREKYDVLTSYL